MMTKGLYNYISIVSVFMGTMLFSCTNSSKEVRDLLKDNNKPIGEAVDIKYHYKNFGRIKNKLETPLLLDFSNRKYHPFKEFPKGSKVTIFQNGGKDSLAIEGDYAITYDETKVSEIRGNVVVTNYAQGTKLETNQLFWDKKGGYMFTEKAFRLTSKKATIEGFGFEAQEDLEKWIAKDLTGDGYLDQE